MWRLSDLNPKPPIFEDQTWIAKAHRTSCSQFGQFSDWIDDSEEFDSDCMIVDLTFQRWNCVFI